MPNFPSIDKGERLASALAKFNTGVEKPLMQLHEILMRSSDSPLSMAQRELIAAYVSGILSCNYCAGIHTRVAENFGINDGLMRELLEDIDTADIDDSFKPILHFVRKSTLTPSQVVPADSQAVFDAGWSERGLYDALMVSCTFNFMNRLVDGIGLQVDPGQYADSADMLMGGYEQIIDKFGLK
ncbi:MAG TPA: carboxymuconolactone decarboxylase family protein [Bacteroidales bacterium]|nr:carboxymuconolactone decarboxylase family protein [Bacteroidales bacterium]